LLIRKQKLKRVDDQSLIFSLVFLLWLAFLVPLIFHDCSPLSLEPSVSAKLSYRGSQRSARAIVRTDLCFALPLPFSSPRSTHFHHLTKISLIYLRLRTFQAHFHGLIFVLFASDAILTAHVVPSLPLPYWFPFSFPPFYLLDLRYIRSHIHLELGYHLHLSGSHHGSRSHD
jgi:hypothetical protein